MKVFWSILLFLLVLIFASFSIENRGDDGLEVGLAAQIEQLTNDLNTYASTSFKTKRGQFRAFDHIRVQYKNLEWILLPTVSTTKLRSINNNKNWAAYSYEKESFFPETGVLQKIEKTLLEEEKVTKVSQIIKAEIEESIRILEESSILLQNQKLSLGRIYYLLKSSLLYHYSNTLNAYDRIEHHKSIHEFRQVLKTQASLLKAYLSEEEAVAECVFLLKQLNAHLKYQSWEQIDRANIYQVWIVPILQEYTKLIQSAAYVLRDTDPLNVENAHLFSDHLFNLNYFTDTATVNDFRALVDLGKQLFYDPILSDNNKRTCASCHKSSKAFTDGRQTSIGFDLISKGKRNAPSLINSIYKGQYQHDLSQVNLFDQITYVIKHPAEMNTSWQKIEQRLSTSTDYLRQFEACFSKSHLDSTQIASALIAYIASLSSLNSPFDQYMRNEIDSIGTLAVEGYNIFMGKAQCGSCHIPPLFSGLQSDQYKDQGYFRINLPERKSDEQGLAHQSIYEEEYRHFFNIPSLRNLSYTSPYFHNGSLFSIEDCIKAHQAEELPMTQILSPKELNALSQFLNTLNDSTLVSTEEVVQLPFTDGTLVPVERRSAGVY
ncbi:MAG: cytochrome-c peroxidase [Bacteroidota bacterium]